MQSLRSGNLALALFMEVAMLAAFCFAGWMVPHELWQRVGLAIALPAVAIVVWALWAAPRAGKRRLKMPALLVFKIVIFALATAAWWLAGQSLIAAIFGALAAINLLAAWAFRQV